MSIPTPEGRAPALCVEICDLSATRPANLATSTCDSNVNLWEMQSLRKALVAAVPSAVNPDIATPTLSSILKSFFCEDDSSDAARFKVASTTNSSFWTWVKRGLHSDLESSREGESDREDQDAFIVRAQFANTYLASDCCAALLHSFHRICSDMVRVGQRLFQIALESLIGSVV